MLSALALGLLAATVPARPNSFAVELGLGASNGEVGLSAARDLTSWLRLEAGAGLGISGLQLSSLARLTLGDRHRLAPGAGVSLSWGSLFKESHDGPTIVMPWLNVDAVAYEYRFDNGSRFLIGGGATSPMRHGHWDAMEMGDDVEPLEAWFPQVHVAIGAAF